MASCFFFHLFFISLQIFTMERGDKKTKKGKIFQGSFGKSRPAKPAKAKKDAAKKEAAKKKDA